MSVGKRFMSVVNMAKNIKEVHPDTLVCYKVGAFVNCYGKDAYILSFLLTLSRLVCKFFYINNFYRSDIVNTRLYHFLYI